MECGVLLSFLVEVFCSLPVSQAKRYNRQLYNCDETFLPLKKKKEERKSVSARKKRRRKP